MSDFEKSVAKFAEILAKFNKIHSLTNYKNINEQVIDSIKPLEFLDFSTFKTAIDVGSGAGFPAIFLALKTPEISWYLFEPNAKKSAFLNFIKVELGLENVKIYSQKIELCPKFRADLITSRALMKIPDFVKICYGFYDINTKFLLYKGSSVNDELKGFNAKIFNEKNRNYILMDGVK
ncbi:16S rRNA (guanine(527)-N(7))-methyltransferase RsmG [Campylobacter mucosalis]|uniref:16S rRNA (guanine(527)-N(7))-methyltransferase RsmG n=1 Tax=Campylobacter mucosalis TaxID=202 RepID=UPI0014703A99|nr:16S rRNA (guanine(527)-N(7))-methyltransferase RsmG [Campylobacter mucosalis]